MKFKDTLIFGLLGSLIAKGIEIMFIIAQNRFISAWIPMQLIFLFLIVAALSYLSYNSFFPAFLIPTLYYFVKEIVNFVIMKLFFIEYIGVPIFASEFPIFTATNFIVIFIESLLLGITGAVIAAFLLRRKIKI